eukprot:4462745-Prymnesium_polylepis.1
MRGPGLVEWDERLSPRAKVPRAPSYRDRTDRAGKALEREIQARTGAETAREAAEQETARERKRRVAAENELDEE